MSVFSKWLIKFLKIKNQLLRAHRSSTGRIWVGRSFLPPQGMQKGARLRRPDTGHLGKKAWTALMWGRGRTDHRRSDPMWQVNKDGVEFLYIFLQVTGSEVLNIRHCYFITKSCPALGDTMDCSSVLIKGIEKEIEWKRRAGERDIRRKRTRDLNILYGGAMCWPKP